MMPDVLITTRCKITSVSGWKDKAGGVRVGIGVKEEVLVPHELADIAKRGANFITTKCLTKSLKKAVLGCLPVTHDGLLCAVKNAYHW
jgi:hypothetical protein